MRLLRPIGPLGRLWPLSQQRQAHDHIEVIDASLHVDTEAICPDCLGWISPWDFVRRNAFDILEHEVCPPVVVRQSRS